MPTDLTLNVVGKRVYRLYREGGLKEVNRGIGDFFRYNFLGRIGHLLPGELIWNRDWDILCVLDGCRLDTFRNTIDDNCGYMRSVGSSSETWIRRTFNNHDVTDVAYLTGNPYSNETNTEDFGYYYEMGISEVNGIETIPPGNLTKHAIYVWRHREELGVNKMIVHYMQPHVPFRSKPAWFSEKNAQENFHSTEWDRVKESEEHREEFFSAYRDNLRWVWEEGVQPITENCDGLIGVTADHGNAAGELGFYGHPSGAPVSSVRHVPWKLLEGHDRHTLSGAPPENGDKSRDIKDVLQALGYR